MVYPQHIAHDLLFGGLDLSCHHSFDGLKWSSEIMNCGAARHFCCNRCQDIFGRKCAVFNMYVGKLDDNPRILIGQHTEHAVIGTYKYMLIELNPNVAIRETAGAVDRHQMDCSFWKFLVNRPQGEGGLCNII